MAQSPLAADRHPAFIQGVLKSQYHAALAMLGQAIERCPNELWTSDTHPNRSWHVAYHAVFCAHMYLQVDESKFVPWERHRENYQYLGSPPSAPYRPPQLAQPYEKAEVMEYLRACDAMVDSAVDGLDLMSPESGFWWYRMSKLEHQIVNIRHIQHHAAQLSDRLRVTEGIGPSWIGGRPAAE